MTTVPSFDYELAQTLDGALRAMADGAMPIHGGTELLPAMDLGLLQPERVVSIRGLDELRVCRRDDDRLVLGAGLSHNDLATMQLIQEGAPLLAEVAQGVGNIRVRCTGTLGGNLAFAEPRSDVATALLALDAHVVLRSVDGGRVLPLSEFMIGAYETELRDGELIESVTIPFNAAEVGVYRKIVFSERPIVGVALARTASTWRLVVGAVGLAPEIVEVDELEEIDAKAIAASIETVEDLGASEKYKEHLTAVTIERCRAAAVAERNKKA